MLIWKIKIPRISLYNASKIIKYFSNKEISVKEKNENDLEWNKNVNSNKINGFAPFASFKCKPLRKNECNFLDEGNKYEKRNNIEPFNYNNNSSQQYKKYEIIKILLFSWLN